MGLIADEKISAKQKAAMKKSKKGLSGISGQPFCKHVGE